MSRSDQWVGLNGSAINLITEEVKGREIGKIVYPDGKEVPYDREITINLVERVQYETLTGAFYNEFPLYKYTLPNGKEYFEYKQAEPWSSGPMFFIALRDSDGNPVQESLWTDKAIDEAVNGTVDEEVYGDDDNYLPRLEDQDDTFKTADEQEYNYPQSDKEGE